MTASLSRLQNSYGELDAPRLLRAMIQDEFSGHIALLTSFGADAAVLLSLVAKVEPALPVLFLDTGKHFPETPDYGRTLTREFGLTDVRFLTPDPALLSRSDADGALWQHQPSRCCWLRKVEPLSRAVESMGLLALITGRRRYQTPERAGLETIELDDRGVFRINPLAHWSREQSAEEAANLPPHPLAAKGYRSIGCAPCTLPVNEADDERAGRWAHTVGLENEQKTECGIHTPAAMMTWSV